MINIIPKGIEVRLCPGLMASEFACKCKNEHCRATIISEELMLAYEKFRKLIDEPLYINSGYRCSAHNLAVKGSVISRHMTGEAIDISLKSIGSFSNKDIEKLAKASGFTMVIFYETFVHLDVR